VMRPVSVEPAGFPVVFASGFLRPNIEPYPS
jgi:hypothetical protein